MLICMTYSSCSVKQQMKQEFEYMPFNSKKDFLLLNYDCKTDVDDLHSIAAVASLLRMPSFSKLNYHAVAGSYGKQGGEYVPANSLFNLAFSDLWSDAHTNFDKAIQEVYFKVATVLKNGGHIWIAEAGQSDFSSSLIAKIQNNWTNINTNEKIHVIQHSEWNEKETREENLIFVKENSKYQKIPDGNVVDNGSPGFSTSAEVNWRNIIENEDVLAIWDLATRLADAYNGAEGRYLNKAIKEGGMDFSDFCEVYHILDLEKADNCQAYLEFIQNQY